MAPYIPPADPRALLPPLLACLPVAFASARPPPALIPLLSPILQQRLALLGQSGTTTTNESWLGLLCWESSDAAHLTTQVETAHLEPHPTSGEIELGDVGAPQFRRLDNETLQALLAVPLLDSLAIYVWCEAVDEGSQGGWRLSELKSASNERGLGPALWKNSVAEADASAYTQHDDSRKILSHPQSGDTSLLAARAGNTDDDAYWAQYDKTPNGEQPADLPQSEQAPAEQTAEDDYFARYANVQPTLDGEDDDDEERASTGISKTEPSHAQGNIPAIDYSSSMQDRTATQAVQAAHSTDSPNRTAQQCLRSGITSLHGLASAAGLSSRDIRQIMLDQLDTLEMNSHA